MKRLKDLSVTKKLVILIAASAALLTFGVGYLIINISTQYAVLEIKERYSQLADAFMNTIDMVMAENYHNIKSFAQDEIFTNGLSSPEEITRYLKMKKIVYGFVSLSYFDMNRIRIADTEGIDIGKQHAITRYWKDVLSDKVSAGTDVRVAEDLKIPIIYFASLVKNKKNKSVGVLVASFNPKRISRMIKNIREEGVHATLFDKQRNIIVTTCPELEFLEMKGKIPESLSVKSAFLGKSGTVLEYLPLHKKEFFCAYAHEKVCADFKGNDWSLLIAIDQDKVFAPIRKLKSVIFVSLIIIVLIVLIIAPVIAYFVTKPIVRLSAIAKGIKLGNFTLRAGVFARDEIGELSDSFNQMAESFKKAREELIFEKTYIEKIISSMTDSLIVFNLDGRIKLANLAALDLLGYEENELLGLGVKEIFLQEEGKEELSYMPFQRIIEKGAVYNIGLTVLTKQGGKIPVNFSGAVIWEGVSITGVVGVIKDMRQIMNFIGDLQKKELELEERNINLIRTERAMLYVMGDLKNSKEVLEKALSAKVEFTDMVSHELRTPLSAIKEGVSLVLEKIIGGINEEQKKYLEIVKSNVDRLARLIDGVLDFQAISSGRAEFKVEENDISEVIKETQKMMQVVANKKNLELICQFDVNLPRVRFDRDKIVQVLVNLVNNALKFTEKGSITIITNKGENYIQVTVKDTGPGINKEDMPKLFQQFVQLRRNVGGTGLGLSICKQIIEAHKGKIWAESPPAGEAGEFGKGTAFHFSLPIKEKRG